MAKTACIRCLIQTESFWIPFIWVEKVLIQPEVISVPGAPESVWGICPYQEVYIPFLKVKTRSDTGKPSACAVILRHGEELVGIYVDEVCEVTEVSESDAADWAMLFASAREDE